MGELAASLHHALLERTPILMTLNPLEDALAIMLLILEVALVGGAICVHGKSTTVSLVYVPGALVLCQDAVSVSLAVIDLETVPVSHFFEVYFEVSRWHRSYFCFFGFRNKLLGYAIKESKLAIVNRSVSFRTETFKLRCVDHLKTKN